MDGPITLVKLWVAELSANALTTPSCGTRIDDDDLLRRRAKRTDDRHEDTSTTICQNSKQAGENQRSENQALNKIRDAA